MSQDKTIYPDEKTRQNQETFLKNALEDQKEHFGFMFKTGNVVYNYYKEQEAEPSEEIFQEWLSILPDNISSDYKLRGYENSKTALPLRRFASEMND